VRQLAEVLGGEVNVASAPGAGATFTVRLPLWPHEPASGGRVVAAPSAGSPAAHEVPAEEASPAPVEAANAPVSVS
jgi:hypothetical protein